MNELQHFFSNRLLLRAHVQLQGSVGCWQLGELVLVVVMFGYGSRFLDSLVRQRHHQCDVNDISLVTVERDEMEMIPSGSRCRHQLQYVVPKISISLPSEFRTNFSIHFCIEANSWTFSLFYSD